MLSETYCEKVGPFKACCIHVHSETYCEKAGGPFKTCCIHVQPETYCEKVGPFNMLHSCTV